MSQSTDERGRTYLPTGVRERFGDRFRIVERSSYVALRPIDDGGRSSSGPDIETVWPDGRPAEPDSDE